jgi:hypothetical protein
LGFDAFTAGFVVAAGLAAPVSAGFFTGLKDLNGVLYKTGPCSLICIMVAMAKTEASALNEAHLALFPGLVMVAKTCPASASQTSVSPSFPVLTA